MMALSYLLIGLVIVLEHDSPGKRRRQSSGRNCKCHHLPTVERCENKNPLTFPWPQHILCSCQLLVTKLLDSVMVLLPLLPRLTIKLCLRSCPNSSSPS